MRRAVVHGTGHSAPEKRLTNEDLERLVDTSDEWIMQRTGIKERRISVDGETASTFGIAAGRTAIERASISPSEIELVICATVTGDQPFPSTACYIQRELGISHAGAFDVGAACAGFPHAITIGAALIESGRYQNILVVGVDTLTKFVDFTDRSTCVLFGDGGGACVLRAEENTDRGVLQSVLLSDGSGADSIGLDIGGSRCPANKMNSCGLRPFLYMNGAEVYRFAVNAMGDACCKALALGGYEASDIDLFVPHQANLRIIESAAKRIGIPDEKVFLNVQHYGNTSGGSIPIALSEAEETGRLQKGMLVMTVGFGAGLVWGANLIRW